MVKYFIYLMLVLFGQVCARAVSFPFERLAKKIGDMMPAIVKKWLNAFIKSKQKFSVEHKSGSPFIITSDEAASFALSVAVLTFSFSYVKAITWQQIIFYIPLVLATTILVEFITARAAFTLIAMKQKGINLKI